MSLNGERGRGEEGTEGKEVCSPGKEKERSVGQGRIAGESAAKFSSSNVRSVVRRERGRAGGDVARETALFVGKQKDPVVDWTIIRRLPVRPV